MTLFQFMLPELGNEVPRHVDYPCQEAETEDGPDNPQSEERLEDTEDATSGLLVGLEEVFPELVGVVSV